MNQVHFSPLSIYKCIDGNYRVVESSALKAVLACGVVPLAVWNGTEHAHNSTCRMLSARQSYDPVGDGNDAEAVR